MKEFISKLFSDSKLTELSQKHFFNMFNNYQKECAEELEHHLGKDIETNHLSLKRKQYNITFR